jgi:hypothetical protein
VDSVIGWGKSFKDLLAIVNEFKGAFGPALAVVEVSARMGANSMKFLWLQAKVLIGAFKWIWNNAPAGVERDQERPQHGLQLGEDQGRPARQLGPKALPGRIGKASRGMWDGFKNAFRSA